MKSLVALLCCFSLCSIPGLAQTKSSRPVMSDQQFVNFAGQTDMVDANLGKWASTAIDSQQVKDFAQKLVVDQTNDYEVLSKIAHQASLIVPKGIDNERNRAMINPLQHLVGIAFDRRFVKEMIAGQTEAIGIYKKEAADARTPALRTYAKEALPILQAQLAEAKKIAPTQEPAKKG